MRNWQDVARKATSALRPLTTMAAVGIHEAWMVPLMLGARLVVVSALALVMVLSAEKGKRIEAIQAVPAVIDALLGRRPR